MLKRAILSERYEDQLNSIEWAKEMNRRLEAGESLDDSPSEEILEEFNFDEYWESCSDRKKWALKQISEALLNQ